jgi:hypothetical protein
MIPKSGCRFSEKIMLQQCPVFREVAMRRSALVATLTALCVLGSSSIASAFDDCEGYYYRCRGFVIPCSLEGVNPVHHPSTFGNPTLARQQYGFIRSPDGTWHVERNCVRGPYHGG